MKWLFFVAGFLLAACSPPGETAVETLPPSAHLAVPFFAQAPDRDWSLPWQETCEEASVILAHAYATGRNLTRADFRREMLHLVEWQERHFGNYRHTTVAQTAEMLRGYYGFTDYRVMDAPDARILERELAAGNAVIAPFAGRLLENPYYSNEGPYYHMMVITGYDADHFIANDVGTARGADFYYAKNSLMAVLHDWHDDDIALGAARIISVSGGTDRRFLPLGR